MLIVLSITRKDYRHFSLCVLCLPAVVPNGQRRVFSVAKELEKSVLAPKGKPVAKYFVFFPFYFLLFT